MIDKVTSKKAYLKSWGCLLAKVARDGTRSIKKDKVGVLKDVILIGNRCIPFYKDYFENVRYPTAIKTRDIDFLVPILSFAKLNQAKLS